MKKRGKRGKRGKSAKRGKEALIGRRPVTLKNTKKYKPYIYLIAYTPVSIWMYGFMYGLANVPPPFLWIQSGAAALSSFHIEAPSRYFIVGTTYNEAVVN
jgi:hypothetical protein